MAYRLTGTDPFFRCSIGAFNGYSMHGSAALSFAALLKRRSTGAWNGIYVVDDGAGTPANYSFPMEFDPFHQIAVDLTTANPFNSTATFNDTTNWMIVGMTLAGSGGAGATAVTWRYKIGSAAWASEAGTSPGSNATAAGAAYRHLIGNEAGLGDDADYDIACVGAIQSNLSQASFESLDMSSFDTWKAVFTGAGAWLIGFDDISSRTDQAGNGGNESSRSSGITLVADPVSTFFGAPPGKPYIPHRMPLGV